VPYRPMELHRNFRMVDLSEPGSDGIEGRSSLALDGAGTQPSGRRGNRHREPCPVLPVLRFCRVGGPKTSRAPSSQAESRSAVDPHRHLNRPFSGLGCASVRECPPNGAGWIRRSAAQPLAPSRRRTAAAVRLLTPSFV
jgi:hypothetical protein